MIMYKGNTIIWISSASWDNFCLCVSINMLETDVIDFENVLVVSQMIKVWKVDILMITWNTMLR